MTITVTLPIRTKNPLNGQVPNTRLAAMLFKRDRAAHRECSRLHVMAAMRQQRLSALELVPCVVTLTRVSAGKMDGDGLQASFKGVRDGVADALQVNDGGEAVEWRYAQRKGPQKHFAVEVRIERKA